MGDGWGDGFLRDMDAQVARAQSFERRMRWFWFRRRLRALPAPELDVIRLRSVTTTGAREVPRPRAGPTDRHPRTAP